VTKDMQFYLFTVAIWYSIRFKLKVILAFLGTCLLLIAHIHYVDT
jgi:hypothetical protein